MRQRGVVFVFSLLTALLASGYGVMFTMLDNFRDSYGISAAALGAVVAVGFFSSFLAQVLLAPLADRGHARRLVLIGIAANLAGLVTMSFGKSTLVLVLARVTMGIGAGMAQPAIRRIVILADPEHLGTNVGRLLAADVAGFAAGPVVAAVLVGPFGIPAPFLVIAVATLVCLPLVVSTHVEEADTAGPDTGTRVAFDLQQTVADGFQALACLDDELVQQFGLVHARPPVGFRVCAAAVSAAARSPSSRAALSTSSCGRAGLTR